MTRSPRFLALLAALFLLSGFSAVLYQVIWQRILGIFSGVHIYSITVIVTAFMAGLGFGSLLGGRIADRFTPKRALVAFAICELAIGLFAFISPWVYYDFAYVRLSALVQHQAMLPAVHFVLLLFPTVLMGASLPLLARGLVRGTEGAARTIGVLYGLNALGAGLGALISVWLFIGEIGFVGTIRVGACLNLIASAGAWWVSRAVPSAPVAGAGERRLSRETPAGTPDPRWLRWALLYGLSGFIALSLEILWFRYLDVGIKSSPYTFGHILGLFLVLLGIGSIVGTITVERSRRPARVFLVGQWGITVCAALSMLFLSTWPADTALLRPFVLHWFGPASPEIAGVLDALGNRSAPGAQSLLELFGRLYFVLPLWLMGVPVFLMGLTYAYVQKTVQTSVGDVGWRTGVVQTMNIVGSMLGSFLTGAVLLELLGTPRSFQWVVGLGMVTFGLLAARQFDAKRSRNTAVAVVLASILLPMSLPGPQEFWSRLHGMQPASVVVAEDATGVAALQLGVPGVDWVPMRVNGKMHSRVPFGDEHTLLGLVPALVHPRMETALIIGLGTGNTAWAAASRPYTREVKVFEIVRPELEVLEELVTMEGPYACVRRLLDDERISLNFTDGRLALRTSAESFDLIEADGLDPSMAFSGNLYSREFFELCRGRLAPGGILCTYVPTERTRRTVIDVFPYVLDFHSRPDFASFIIAATTPLEFDKEVLRQRFDEASTQTYLDEAGLGEYTRELFLRFLSNLEVTVIDDRNRTQYSSGDVNTDLFPRDEFDKEYRGDYQ